jgi:phage terminase large subunit-like protein
MLNVKENRAQKTVSDEDYYSDINEYLGVKSLSRRAIDYLDSKPRKFVVQIPLVDYFERVKRYRADRWQRDFCNRLQHIAETRHEKRYWGIFHAEGQLGKTTILSQCFPAWLMGNDPLFRFALAMYNAKQSEKHSKVIIQMMNSLVHKDIFPKKEGWLASEKEPQTGWMTNARRELNDGQYSLNPVGLISGLTGSGFDWLSIDDPYRSQKDAFSETINLSMRDFYDYTVLSRTGLHSCITGMFHRYAPEDFGGYLLDTGDFDYVRYATQCDGDYIHDNTGQRFVDPLGRAEGEYISPERRPPRYYEKARKNNRVWLSMFQGRPSSEEGDFFNVGKIAVITKAEAEKAMQECVVVTRSYDHASTAEAGAYSVGVKGGMRPSGVMTIFHIWRERVDTARRLQKQQELAVEDGVDVTVTVPIDPGAAGRDVVWFTEQKMEGYTVIGRPTSGSKEDRAMNLSTAVNSGEIEFVDDSDLPEDERWIKEAKKELRDFPLSEYKDIVDAMSDNYNYNYSLIRKGMIIKNFRPQRNLFSVESFARKFPASSDGNYLKIPAKWAIYIGLKLEADASRPTCAVIAARASANSRLPETLFALAEYKAYDSDFYKVFDWIDLVLKETCEDADATIWLHPDSEPLMNTINQKLKHPVVIFQEDSHAGLTETNWYLLPKEEAHPVNQMEQAAHLYFLIPETEFDAPVKPSDPAQAVLSGFYHARQEVKTWGYDDKGDPTKIGGVLDCLRMITFKFRSYAEPLTLQEEYETLIPQEAMPKQNEDGTFEMDKAAQQRWELARRNARLHLEEKYGEDALADDDDVRPWWE